MIEEKGKIVPGAGRHKGARAADSGCQSGQVRNAILDQGLSLLCESWCNELDFQRTAENSQSAAP
jgi:hypothetical protein